MIRWLINTIRGAVTLPLSRAKVSEFDLRKEGTTPWYRLTRTFRNTPMFMRRHNHGLEVRVTHPDLSTAAVAAVGAEHYYIQSVLSERDEASMSDMLYSVSDWLHRQDRDYSTEDCNIAAGLISILLRADHAERVMDRAIALGGERDRMVTTTAAPPDFSPEAVEVETEDDVPEQSVEESRAASVVRDSRPPSDPVEGDWWIYVDPDTGNTGMFYWQGGQWNSPSADPVPGDTTSGPEEPAGRSGVPMPGRRKRRVEL